MLKAAELALFDAATAHPADDRRRRLARSGAAAATSIAGQGAEIIVGPLFGPSVTAVAPIARDRGVPVLAFSTDRSVAGNGVYLLCFLPENEVQARRVLCGGAGPSRISRPWCRTRLMATWSSKPSATR